MEPQKTWKERAIERYEEYADVHSEKNFTALMRALAVAETTIVEEREKVLGEVRGNLFSDDPECEHGFNPAEECTNVHCEKRFRRALLTSLKELN